MSAEALLVRLPNWVGDGALAVPAVRALQAARPAAPLLLVGTDRSGPLYGRWPSASLVPADRRSSRDLLRLRRLLRAGTVAEALVLAPSFRAALAPRLAGVRRRVGFATDGRRLLLSDPVTAPPRSSHLARQYLELAGRLGADRDAPLDPRVPIGPDEREAAGRRLASLGLEGARSVALCPGATYGETKRWPRAHWVALGRKLAGQGWSLLVLGGAAERAEGEALAGAAGRAARTLAGSLSLRESLALFSLLAGAVSNDSGAMHLAAAAGCPVVGLFGSTSPDWTGPLGKRSRAVTLGLPCSPCFARSCPTEIECLGDLSVDQVAHALEKTIDRPGGGEG